MNEALFFAHILATLGFLAVAVRLGPGALTAFVSLTAVLANLFVLKQITLFGFEVTCSDVFAVGGILGLNLIQELYGRHEARLAIRASMLTLILFGCMTQIHLLYAPSEFDRTQESFVSIFASTPRIVMASMGVYYIVQLFDMAFFAQLKKRLEPFGARLAISLVVSQALDTVLFSFIALYGLVESILDIVVVSFVVKCAIIACSSPLGALLKRCQRETA